MMAVNNRTISQSVAGPAEGVGEAGTGLQPRGLGPPRPVQ